MNFKSGTGLQGLIGIEKHPIILLAQKTPVFLLAGKVYAATEGASGTGYFEEKWIFFTHRMPVVEITSFDEIDDLFLNRIHKEIENAGKEYAQQVLRQLDIVKKVEGEYDTPQLIYKCVFPYLSGTKNRGKRLAELVLGVEEGTFFVPELKTQTEIGLLEGMVNEGMKEIGERIEHISSEDDKGRSAREKRLEELIVNKDAYEPSGSCFLSRAFGGLDLAMINNQIYWLFPCGIRKSKWRVEINGKTYRLMKAGSRFGDWEAQYMIPFSKSVRISALREISHEKLMQVLIDNQTETGFKDITGRTHYQEEDFGFTQNNGNYFAFLEVPAFVIRSQFDGRCYLFEKTRIGIKVWKSEEGLDYDSKFAMIDNNNHPFLHNEKKNYADICTGHQSFPTSGSDTGEIIAKRLRICREMLMYGYTRSGYYAHYELRPSLCGCHPGKNFFQDNIRSKELIEKKGIPIIQGGPR